MLETHDVHDCLWIRKYAVFGGNLSLILSNNLAADHVLQKHSGANYNLIQITESQLANPSL